jgi:exodeoxyribonuclease V beta subunit
MVEVRQAVVEATASEIARLLQLSQEGRLVLQGRALDGGDIAVLVRTHAQAKVVAQALGSLGVNSVRLSQESVFHSPEAEQLEWLLQALAEPRREPLVRAALATDLLGWNAVDIDALNRDDRRQSDLQELFHGYHRQWRDDGFISMFRHLLLEQGVEKRLLEFKDGERRVTNLYQLVELLQRQDRSAGAGQEALLKWFSRQRQAEQVIAEERLLRLESDSHLVKIVTLHASKGLEYGVVFIAGCEENLFPHWKSLETPEGIQEERRLMYVAVTRAERCLYVTSANLRKGQFNPRSRFIDEIEAVLDDD